MSNILQKLMFWRKAEEPKTAEPLAPSWQIDPPESPSRPTEDQEYEAERKRKLLEDHERKVEGGEPPDYEFSP